MGININSIAGLDPQMTAEKAVCVIGQGYDLCSDIRFSACKSRLVEIETAHTRDLVFPVGVVVPNVPTSIKCDKGERTRFRSDVLPFNQMSEHFNGHLSLSGKIPSGLFNNMFDMRKCWPMDAASTKNLAYDGWYITLYNVELDRTNITLSESVKREVPSSWNPAALAEFIEKYGTHIVVGVKMGGKDVVHIKQSKNSDLQPAELQKLLKKLADERFSENSNQSSNVNPAEISGKLKDDHAKLRRTTAAGRPVVRRQSKNDDIVSISVRKGGVDIGQSYNQWLSTIAQSPNVISMSFVPITSLLNSVPGNGFLSHAVNLYLRYKPAIEELHQFLEFQLPRQWAPMYGDLPLGYGPKHKRNISPSLQFTLMGPKLYVSTVKVDSGNRPVTGIRLYLEGQKCDHLAIHLQHLSEVPGVLEISEDHGYDPIDEPVERGYYEPVKWSMFSHVYTAPVQYNSSHIDESTSIVTKAWFEVKLVGMKKVLFLRLGFSTVASAKSRRSEWDGPSTTSRKSGLFSALMSTRLSKELQSPEKPTKVDINSAIYHGGPPVPTRAPKMLSFVDTKEMVRGPEDLPGYWVVTGAKLCVEGGRISIKAKYSLLTIMSEESLMLGV
ncbi:MACPF domain-containing protein NSL1 [Gastrolobium bilobum]|uniref:MACPF domain-containing protein NSL1 n=1 Tax=Gastrolobium bilobum TaxID=150636 RepID=UPI002AB24B30|nr:MACPF domain-containing protein NSL1 [Gastrolobium bilobum]